MDVINDDDSGGHTRTAGGLLGAYRITSMSYNDKNINYSDTNMHIHRY